MEKIVLKETKEAQRQEMFKVAGALRNTLEKASGDDVVKILAVWKFSSELIEEHFGKEDGVRFSDDFARTIFSKHELIAAIWMAKEILRERKLTKKEI